MHYLALATDYDGTIANDGVVDKSTLAALERLRGGARRLILVTGRELTDLRRAMPRLDLFDLVVAENGALLYDPANHEERALGDAPPPAFVERLRELGVAPLWRGRVIVATRDTNEDKVLGAIGDLGLDLQDHVQQERRHGAAGGRHQGERLARRTGATRSVAARLHRGRRCRERPCLP